MNRTAGVTVMACRNLADRPDGTIALAAAEIQAGSALGRPVRIGQETNHLGGAPYETKQTVFGQTRTQMEVHLAAITNAYTGTASFAGLAIHDATGYAAMAP